LRPKFGFEEFHVSALLEQIKSSGILTAGRPMACILTDPNDMPFLEVAVSAGAECLVTGNRRHFPQSIANPIKIVTPSEFLEFYKTKPPT
jgi:uncharacterized protein